MKITDYSIDCCEYKENCSFFLESETRFYKKSCSKKICLFADERNNRIIIINNMIDSVSFPSIKETIESLDGFAIKHIEDTMYLANGITIVIFEDGTNKAKYVILYDNVCNTLEIDMSYGMTNIEEYIGKSKQCVSVLPKDIQYTEITNGVRETVLFD